MKAPWLILIGFFATAPLGAVGPAAQTEVVGKVTAVSGPTVQIQIEGNARPASGDSVELSFEVPNVGAVPLDGVWRVTAISGQVVTATREGAESAKPQVGYQARIRGASAPSAEKPSEPATPGSTAPMPAAEPAKTASPSFEGQAAGQQRNDNDWKIPLSWCPPGKFRMGSPATEAGRGDNEESREVTVSAGFWIGTHEVTQAQWTLAMGRTLLDQARLALHDDTMFQMGDRRLTLREFFGQPRDADPMNVVCVELPEIPIYFVSWEEATEFCKRLTEREQKAGRLPEGWRYRLPSEAQWEYACRAGTSGATYTGDLTIKGRAHAPELDAIAWYGGNSSVGYPWRGIDTSAWMEKQYPGGTAGPRQIGQKAGNGWQLHDMLGNVSEWCEDSSGEPGGKGPGFRMVRGGSWLADAVQCRASWRGSSEPGFRCQDLGFRIAAVRDGE